LTTSSQRKGSGYERELAAHINEVTGLDSFRAPLSGGGNLKMTGGSDIMGTPEVFIEAKRVERLNFHDALRQAERNIRTAKSPDMPLVVNRRNRMKTGESLCLLRLDDFLKLYTSYLKQEGYVEADQDVRKM
jgi:hypothetical protein